MTPEEFSAAVEQYQNMRPIKDIAREFKTSSGTLIKKFMAVGIRIRKPGECRKGVAEGAFLIRPKKIQLSATFKSLDLDIQMDIKEKLTHLLYCKHKSISEAAEMLEIGPDDAYWLFLNNKINRNKIISEYCEDKRAKILSIIKEKFIERRWSIKQISEYFGIHSPTVRRYLTKGCGVNIDAIESMREKEEGNNALINAYFGITTKRNK